MANELVVQEPQTLVQLGTLQASTPQALVAGATSIANTLSKLIRDKHLYKNIQGRDHVLVEGWTVLGAILGVIAREESVVELPDGGYLATVALVRMSDGAVVSRASSECGMDEPTWAKRNRYARRSMALTRATGKASRLAFSWIISLAGFQPTPAEEMPEEERQHHIPAKADPKADLLTCQVGKNKGKAWDSLTDKEIDWYADKGFEGAIKQFNERRVAIQQRHLGPDRDEPKTTETVEEMQSDVPF